MTQEDLFGKAKLLKLECEMNGMVAENKQREFQGYAMAYGENDFLLLQNRIEELIQGRFTR